MKLLDDLVFMRNRAFSPDVKVPRLMFYHIPKTGGLYVYNALGSAILLMSQLTKASHPQFPGFEVGRIDSPEERDRINALWLVGTHLPYGWHLDYKLATPFQLFTLVRDPFERVLSNYTYNCMRSEKKPAVAEFLEFAALPENCDTMVRHFCGGTQDSQLDVAHARDILERDFLAYDTIEHIPDMIEGLLTYANLPNVMVGGKINFTMNEYKLDAAELRPQIEALNRADAEFYAEIKASPRRLSLPASESYFPATVLLKESGASGGSQTRVQSVKTDQLLDVVARATSAEEVFATFFR
jgi:hypothetical protein